MNSKAEQIVQNTRKHEERGKIPSHSHWTGWMMVLKFDKITQNPELPVVWMYVSFFYQRTQQIFCALPAPKCRRSLEPNSINTLHIMSRPFVVVWLDCVFRCRLFVFFVPSCWENRSVDKYQGSIEKHTYTHIRSLIVSSQWY